MRPSAPHLVWECPRTGLAAELLHDLEDAVAAYAEESGDESVTVTSGRRTLRRQAELMAAFSQDQLVALYGRQGMPCYVQAIGEFRQREGRDPSAAEVYDILRSRANGYISDHLYGGAVDIASSSVGNVDLFRRHLHEHGFRTIDERAQGIACIHASHRGVPRRIVRD
jgi:hypothetical protein